MGYIRGPWWRFINDENTDTRRLYAVAWGKIVTDPQEKYKDSRVIRFAIKTGRGAGRSEKYLVCAGYGEQLATVIMKALERGDYVFVAGTWVERQRVKTKKGVKAMYELQVEFIIPFGAVALMMDMLGTPEIMGAVERHKNDDADPFEYDG